MVAVIFMAVFVISLLLSPAVILLWMWNKETPTLEEGNSKGR
jgi:ABC-type transport system involved in cytochrome c biogenesis permease subunit